jgi:putative DNA primase/helicase
MRWACRGRLRQLRVNAMGVPRPVAYNAAIALTQDLAFSGAIRYDRLSHRVTLCRGVPWDPHPVVIPRPWKASDDVSATLWLQENQIMVRTTVVREVVDHIAQNNAYHPVIDFFNSIGGTSPRTIWDAKRRVGDADTPSWLTTYLGVEDTPYARAW